MRGNSTEDSFRQAKLFEQALRTTHPSIKFLGLWDTVSSVIVPRRDRFYLPSLRQLAYTKRNPSVEIVRHALSIDEKRCMFRPRLWLEGQPFWGSPFERDNAPAQDVKQVWFAGYHSDVGGGEPEAESGLSKITLEWMIQECPDGLLLNTQSVNQIVLGRPRKGSSHKYAEPDPKAPDHDSMGAAWPILEYIPQKMPDGADPNRRSLFGLYLPRSAPRRIPEGASLHSSVTERMAAGIGYEPPNPRQPA